MRIATIKKRYHDGTFAVVFSPYPGEEAEYRAISTVRRVPRVEEAVCTEVAIGDQVLIERITGTRPKPHICYVIMGLIQPADASR